MNVKNRIGGAMNAIMGQTNKGGIKSFFGYNTPTTISSNPVSAVLSKVTGTAPAPTPSTSYTMIFVLIGLFALIFAGIYLYFKTFGYTIQMGLDRLMGKFENKDKIDMTLNGGDESKMTASLVPPSSDSAESKKLKDLLGLASESTGQLPFNPEERPSGMPGSKESPDFLERAARQIKKTFGPDQQVFNVSRNIYTYGDAAPLCKAMGAELATYEQLVESQKHGADWCNYGWVKGQMAAFPVQEKTWNKLQTGPVEYRESCGKPGINGGFFDNPELRFGVNCFGPRPEKKDTDELITENIFPPTAEEIEFDKKVNKFREQMNNITVLPWNRDKWQGT